MAIPQFTVQVRKYAYTVPKMYIEQVKKQVVFDKYFDNFKSFDDALDFISSEFRKKKNEAIYALKETGEIKYKVEGSKYSVATPIEFDEASKGIINIHNHPAVGSFSSGDIENACMLGLKKTMVVDKKYRYTMQPANGKDFSPSMWEPVDKLFKKYHMAVRGELNDLLRNGKITENDRDELLDHMIWQKVAKNAGLKYMREKYTNMKYVVDHI